MTTFADLGIPFPLYEAPVETCTDYQGSKLCCASGEQRDHCFLLGPGDYLRISCSECKGMLYLLPTEDSLRATACRHCNAPTPPPVASENEAYVSYEALRAGDVVITKDTDYGMISWENVENRWTHGIPGATFEGIVTRTTKDGWTQAKLREDDVSELTRTPNFATWQGAVWLFHEGRPMTFVGEWKRKDFEERTPAGSTAMTYWRSVVRDADDSLWEYIDGVCTYVFRAANGGVYKAYYDMD